MTLTKIISGGQTGADRAGLDAAKLLGLDTGGFIPKGCRTDDGPLSPELMKYYGLVEHSSPAYPPRTLANVLASDATVLFGNVNSPGTQLTIRYCMSNKKPMKFNPLPVELKMWVESNGFKVLNVAGNRERTNQGIHYRTVQLIVEAFKA